MTKEQIDYLIPYFLFLEDWITVYEYNNAVEKEKQFSAINVDFDNIDQAVKWWNGMLEKYDKDSTHCGDCTNQPAPCVACFVESEREKAQRRITYLLED